MDWIRSIFWLSLIALCACEPGRITTTRLITPPDDGLSADRGPLTDSQVNPDFKVSDSDSRVTDQDASWAPDVNAPRRDAAVPPQPDAAVDPCPGGCPNNASCTANGCRCDAGYHQEGERCAADDPCAEVQCGPSAQCQGGDCVCLPGFIDQQGECVPAPQNPLESRTEAEVCARWRTDYVAVNPEWQGGAELCDPGVMTDAGQANAIRRTNLYRWLAGLNPVGLAAAIVPAQQECATMMNALNGITHSPSADTPCYTQAGASAAGQSNLALGTGAAGSVDLYIGDRGVGSLGHRRWVLNPGARETAFGYKGRTSCMYSFSNGGQHQVDYVTWPPAGIVPAQAASGTWHVSFYRVAPGPDFSIEVAVGDGAFEAVEPMRLPGGYGGQVPAFTFGTPAQWAPGTTVRVAFRGLRDHEDLEHTTRFVDCR